MKYFRKDLTRGFFPMCNSALSLLPLYNASDVKLLQVIKIQEKILQINSSQKNCLDKSFYSWAVTDKCYKTSTRDGCSSFSVCRKNILATTSFSRLKRHRKTAGCRVEVLKSSVSSVISTRFQRRKEFTHYNAIVHQGALQMFWHHSYNVIMTEEMLLRSQVYNTDVPVSRGIPSFLLQTF